MSNHLVLAYDEIIAESHKVAMTDDNPKKLLSRMNRLEEELNELKTELATSVESNNKLLLQVHDYIRKLEERVS